MDGQTQCQLSVIRARESDKCWPRACKLAFTLTIILVLVVLLEYTAMMMMETSDATRQRTQTQKECKGKGAAEEGFITFTWQYRSQNSVGIDHGVMLKLHADSTSAAPHKTQGKRERKTDRWKIDCERRREEEEHKTLLRFPSPKTLNYYYWVLIFYFNIVHTCGPIRNKSLWHAHMIRLPVFCYDAVRSRSYMPDHT